MPRSEIVRSLLNIRELCNSRVPNIHAYFHSSIHRLIEELVALDHSYSFLHVGKMWPCPGLTTCITPRKKKLYLGGIPHNRPTVIRISIFYKKGLSHPESEAFMSVEPEITTIIFFVKMSHMCADSVIIPAKLSNTLPLGANYWHPCLLEKT